MSRLWLWTRQLSESQCESVIVQALDLWYRHIDTASVYHNEVAIGSAWRQSGVKREHLRITSKLFGSEYRKRETIITSIEKSLADLQIDYLDVMLLHRPTTQDEHHRVLDILLEYKEKGMIRNIGVSNFNSEQLLDVISYTDHNINIYQWEYHICLDQSLLLSICKKHTIIFEAYSPLAHGKLWNHHEIILKIQSIAIKHDMTVAQVMLNRLRQQDITILPKSSHYSRLLENFMSQHFILDDEDNTTIVWLPKNFRYCNPSQIAPKRD